MIRKCSHIFLLHFLFVDTKFNSKSSKTFKNIRKQLKYMCMTILELVESFKTMNRPDPVSLTAYFSKSIKDRNVKL